MSDAHLGMLGVVVSTLVLVASFFLETTVNRRGSPIPAPRRRRLAIWAPKSAEPRAKEAPAPPDYTPYGWMQD